MFDKPLCENQAFSFHMYTWFGDDRKKKLAAYQAFAQKQNTPLWAGEFGENSYEMIRSPWKCTTDVPEINGWAFWTWKKAPSKSPGLVIDQGAEGLGDRHGIGSAACSGKDSRFGKVRTGIKEFIEAMKFKNCEYDERMEKALLPKH